MKTIILVLLCFCSVSLSAFDWKNGWDAEFRVAAFRPNSPTFRKVYENWGVSYQLQACKELYCGYYAWANVSYFSKDGHTTTLHDKTNIRIVPLSLGINYVFPITCNLDVYWGGGVTYCFIRETTHSCVLKHAVNRQEFGGIFKTGFNYDIRECAFIGIFADYLVQKFHADHREASVGGWLLGGSIGWYF